MAIPAYMWIKDDGGADIKGSVTVHGREGSVELVEFNHGVNIPTDDNTGKLTGTRVHAPITFTKETDASTPYLYKAVTSGQTLKSIEIKWYRIDDAGKEKEYFNTKLDNVKVVAVKPRCSTSRIRRSRNTTTSKTSNCATRRSPGRTRTATSSTPTAGTNAPESVPPRWHQRAESTSVRCQRFSSVRHAD
jgi:type VI secretion system secreted protein Hcp